MSKPSSKSPAEMKEHYTLRTAPGLLFSFIKVPSPLQQCKPRGNLLSLPLVGRRLWSEDFKIKLCFQSTRQQRKQCEESHKQTEPSLSGTQELEGNRWGVLSWLPVHSLAATYYALRKLCKVNASKFKAVTMDGSLLRRFSHSPEKNVFKHLNSPQTLHTGGLIRVVHYALELASGH